MRIAITTAMVIVVLATQTAADLNQERAWEDCARPNLLGEGRTRLIGVVDVPAIFGTAKTGKVSLRDHPSLEAGITRVITSPKDLQCVEHDDNRSALVLEKRSEWFLIRYVAGDDERTAWLGPADAGKFRSLHNLYDERLTYMTSAWDGRVYRTPGGSQFQILEAPRDVTRFVTVVDSDRVDPESKRADGGDLWWLVVLLGRGVCEAGPREVIGAGWIPAHGADGKPTIWFYSWGC